MRGFMAKAYSTILEERVVIAKRCLDNGKNYRQTAEDFNVSYQWVYQWVENSRKVTKMIKNGAHIINDIRRAKVTLLWPR
ncbi:helix-turn-helix domain-containing protein [Priestia megaterium]